MGTFRDTPEALEARPSDETTRLTTRPFPVEGATGGLGACLLDEDGLKAEVETGLLKLKLKIKYLGILVSGCQFANFVFLGQPCLMNLMC